MKLDRESIELQIKKHIDLKKDKYSNRTTLWKKVKCCYLLCRVVLAFI